MTLDYNDCFWGDSELEKIEIVYDKIMVTIFNDVLQRNIIAECSQCVGMTQFINWDEIIIDNVILKELQTDKHTMINEVRKLYGVNSNAGKSLLEGTFYELRIELIGGLSFSVICKNVSFYSD